tara:strand:- start:229 stop:1494 length:1266 start_codon:yes stop_codon:yes gene_type:complete
MIKSKQQLKSKVINLGCRLNFFESGIIQDVLDKNEVKQTIVINTCAVTNNAVKKSIYEIRKARKMFPNSKIVVTGCASQVEKNKFQGFKEIDSIVDNKTKTDVSHYFNDRVHLYDYNRIPYAINNYQDRTRAFLQIQQGCDHRCTFCIIPYGRGNAYSLPVGEISRRLENLLVSGFKEITLTGVDLTSYGNDLPGKPKLGNVIKRLLSLHPKLKRLRLSSIDPAEIDSELLELFQSEEKLLPYLHLSVQSGDNMILKRMKRRHTREDVLRIFKEIKGKRDEVKFGADIIVGFPTETDEHFKNTLELVKKCEISNLHLFTFSPKIGTPAAKMPQVKKQIKDERYRELLETSSLIKKKYLHDKIGMIQSILFESEKQSYTDDYFKVKIGIDNNKTHHSITKSGEIIKVLINSVSDDQLIANFI